MHTDLLETPDIYWEHPRLEELYHMVSREMDIVSRVACTNRFFFAPCPPRITCQQSLCFDTMRCLCCRKLDYGKELIETLR